MGPRRKLLLVLPVALVAGTLTLSSCSTLPALERREASTALQGTDDTRLGRAVAPASMAHPGLAGIHVLADGRIVRTGGGELVDELESRGYEFLKDTETVEKA